MRARRLGVTVLAATLAALALPRGAAAGARPELVADVGGNAAVEGNPNGGGPSLGFSLLWRLENHFRVGMMGFVDDLGDHSGRLRSPSGEDLGPISAFHRTARGAAWRMEAHIPSRGFVTPCVAATWGLYRIGDDVRGETFRRTNVAGFGLGVGVLRAINDRNQAGAVVRFQQLSRGSTVRYLSATLEWRRGRGAAE